MKVLLVANQTLGGAELAERLSALHGAEPDLTLHVLVPAAVVGVIADPTEMLSLIAVDVESERREAAERLETLLAWLHRGGVQATGEITVAQPLLAIATATRRHRFDRVVLSTFPPGVSRWLRMDLAHRVRRVCNLPVDTIVNAATSSTLPELMPVSASASGQGVDPPVIDVVVVATGERLSALRAAIESGSIPTRITDTADLSQLGALFLAPTPGERAVVIAAEDGATSAEVIAAAAEIRRVAPGASVSVATWRNDPEWRAALHEEGVSYFVLSGDADVDARLFGVLSTEFIALRRLAEPDRGPDRGAPG